VQAVQSVAMNIAAPEAVEAVVQACDSVHTAFIEHRSEWMAHKLERMDVVCRGCNALH